MEQIKLTNCCKAYSTYHDETLICKSCYNEVEVGEGDGTEIEQSEYSPVYKVRMERKPCHIGDVKVGEFSTIEECIVVNDLEVANKEWKDIVNDFFKHNDIWENIGGSNEQDMTLVTRLTNKVTKEVIFVNTEGYDYARYVGIEVK